jgi:hypothetical protein
MSSEPSVLHTDVKREVTSTVDDGKDVYADIEIDEAFSIVPQSPARPNFSADSSEDQGNGARFTRTVRPSSQNRQRAKRAAKALSKTEYKNDELEWSSAVADLITDLLHLADFRDFDFEHVLHIAKVNYFSERSDDA